MKLYTYPPSSNAMRATVVANQLSFEVERITIDLAKGEQNSEAFAKVNPNRKVPTLVDGDFVLWESHVIMMYLAEKDPDCGLIPSDTQERYKIQQWLAWNLSHLAPQVSTMLFERFLKPKFGMGETDEVVVAKVENQFHSFAKILNSHLRGRDSIVGSTLTVADHAVGADFIYAKQSLLPMDDYKEIQRWWDNIAQMEAWKKTLASSFQ